ncbi:hypothetical protein, partial [Rugamonas sp.]|uniref:hypothetical protein n=1 Tax=Rugamonas sp. TaxID=1926287 RepID=UPI0025D08A93
MNFISLVPVLDFQVRSVAQETVYIKKSGRQTVECDADGGQRHPNKKSGIQGRRFFTSISGRRFSPR